MLILLLAGILLALAGPLLHRFREGVVPWLFTAFAGGSFAWFLFRLGPVGRGEALRESLPWAPSLGVSLSLHLDGLSLLFALLTTGIGFLVLLYSFAYLHSHRYRDRFFGYIFLFMMSMLGVVLADDMTLLFVFWEMTTVTSYLLIGFEHEHHTPRKWALQALLVTGGGGLALLAGLVLLAQVTGAWELTALPRGDAGLHGHPLYLPILLLVALGCFTKSAQFPFHFWLPSAMIAPTPVSAFLHSAAMVKAGVYLLARLLPVLGGTDAWHLAIGLGGGVTMVAGACLAVAQTEVKRLLAYATVAVLGILVLMLGLGTATAVKAAMVYLLVHALYKGALFMVAGAVTHVTGSRELDQPPELWRHMPWSAGIAILAALSMAGLPPMFGYLGKELLYEAELHFPLHPPWLSVAGLLANGLLVAAAAIFVVAIFFRGSLETQRTLHSAPPLMSLAPFPLALGGLLLGLWPDLVDTPLLTPAVTAVHALGEPLELRLWHGINPVFLLGAASLILGTGFFLARLRFSFASLRKVPGPGSLYHLLLGFADLLARIWTRLQQHGNLRIYLATVLVAAILMIGATVAKHWPVSAAGGGDVRLHEALTALMALSGACLAALSPSILTAVLALGTTGYAIAFLYLLSGAPDLAMTQFGIETLAIILFVLILHRLPNRPLRSRSWAQLRDVLLALAGGAVMGCLVFAARSGPGKSRLSSYFIEQALPEGHGRNVVNVILVDFRGLDTLGEIIVLGAAAVGVSVLLRRGKAHREGARR